MEPFDLILLVVIGDLVQQGVTQSDYSLTGATMVIVTVARADRGHRVASFRFRRLRPVLEGDPVILVADGRVLERNLRRQRMTVDGAGRRGPARADRLAGGRPLRGARDERQGQLRHCLVRLTLAALRGAQLHHRGEE